MGAMNGFGSGFANELGFSDAWSGAFHVPVAAPPTATFSLPATYVGDAPEFRITWGGITYGGASFVLNAPLSAATNDEVYTIDLTNQSWSGVGSVKVETVSNSNVTINGLDSQTNFYSVYTTSDPGGITTHGPMPFPGEPGSESDISSALAVVMLIQPTGIVGPVGIRCVIILHPLPF